MRVPIKIATMQLSNELTPDRRQRQSRHLPIISRPITGHTMVPQVARPVSDRSQIKPIRPIIRPAVRDKLAPKPSLKAVLRTDKPKISPHPSPHLSLIQPIRQRMLSVSRQPTRQIHPQTRTITPSPAIARSITDRPTPPSLQNHRHRHRLNQNSSPRRHLVLRQSLHLASPHLVNRHIVNGLVPHQKFLKLLLKRLPKHRHPFPTRRPLADRAWI